MRPSIAVKGQAVVGEHGDERTVRLTTVLTLVRQGSDDDSPLDDDVEEEDDDDDDDDHDDIS